MTLTRSGVWRGLGASILFLSWLGQNSSSDRAHPAEPALPGLRLDRHGDAVPQFAVARLGTMRFRHGSSVLALSYSPDGKILASGSFDGTASLWDADTGREIHRLGGHQLQGYMGKVVCLAFSPNGKLLATAAEDHLIRLWDVERGTQVRQIKAQHVQHLTFSPTGEVLASSSEGISLWDVSTGQPLAPNLQGGTGSAWLGFALSGKVLVASYPDGREVGGSLTAFDWKAEKRLYTVYSGSHTGAFALSPDTKSIYIENHGAIQERAVATGKEIRTVGHCRSSYSSLVLSPDGKILAVDNVDRGVVFVQVANGKAIRHTGPALERLGNLAFSPDGKRLATGGQGLLIRLWDVGTGKQVQDLRGHQYGIFSLAFSPDGELVATGSGDRTLRLWDPITGKEKKLFANPAGPVRSVAFSPTGDTLIALSPYGATTWEVKSGAKSRDITLKQLPILGCAAYSPDSKLLALGGYQNKSSAEGSYEGKVVLIEAATGKELRLLGTHRGGPVGAVSFSPDGKLLASGGGDRLVYLRDVTTGAELHCLRGHAGALTSLAFSPDGKTLYSTSERERAVRVWDTVTGKERVALEIAKLQIMSISQSPDGRLLAAASFDKSVILCDLLTGKNVAVLRGHRGMVYSVAFAPDGKTVVSGSHDATALVWDVASATGASKRSDSLKEAEAEAAWKDLTGEDAQRSYQALWTLTASPDLALPLLSRHIRPAATLDEGRLKVLLDQLDSRNFREREKAVAEMEILGDQDLPALRAAREKHQSPEVRRRLGEILTRLDSAQVSGVRLGSFRAVHLLETIGSADARKVLETLARGAAGSFQTREAQAALKRLDTRRTKR